MTDERLDGADATSRNRVDIFLDDAARPLLSTTPPLSFELDTSRLEDGPHVMRIEAYDVHGVHGASAIAMSQVVPAALLASAAAARLGRMRAPRALRLGYALQAVMAAVVGAALLADASFALVCVLAAVGSVAITLTRPVHNALLPEISDTTSELTAANAG